ncbi:RE1 [Symbiodinium natans]|uniref:RE1 protein n=1 Tax=Symbiodinium natans TaxID=878477 RepID=A0A812TTW1_9DINO|nr:RE1 [Symbiodinium natans]
MAQLQIPSEILHSLQHLANVNLGGLQDLDTLRQGMGMLAQELNVRTESLSKAVTAVADLSSMVRDGAMVLEGQVKDASDERQCLVAQMNRVWKNQEDFSARLLALEGAASRLEESSMQQQAALRELDLKLGGLNLAFDQAREAVQQLQDEDPASLESAVGTMRSQTALLSTTMTRLEALSHDVELANRRVAQQEAASKKDLEQLASVTDATVKLEARCEQIERALEERGQLMAPVPERTVRFQQTSKPPEVAKPTTSWQPLPGTEETQVQRFEMSPESLQQPAIDEWYTAEEEGEGPASWDFSSKPPGLFQPQSLPPPLPEVARRIGSGHAFEKVPAGQWKMLKDCPVLKLNSDEPWERGLVLRQWENETGAIAAVVASSFGAFFRRRMKEALDRYQQRQSSGVEEDVPSIPPEEREYETRLGVMLIKVLPASIRQPVMERTTSLEEPLSTLLLLESVIERFSPGGTSEMTSLLQYQRCLPTANSYKELLKILRKFDLARTRTTYLQLPGLPAHEVIKSLDGLTRTLERKNPALAMRLNLIRMTPEVMVPSETGVQRMLTTLVQEGRRLQAEDEISKSKPHYPTSSKKNRYTVMSYGEEQLANRVEQELIEASIAPAQAEVVGLEGFYGEKREAWKMSLEKEYAKMDGVLEEALPEELRSKLGLPPDAPLPKPIPSKVVCTLKPNIDGSSEKLEKSRLCACGNFEQGVDDNGEPWSSSNIPPEIVRCFTSLAASNVTWTLGSLDVEAAFLNAEITSGDPVIIMPPKVMKDLGMVRPRTLWIARRLIYGLRRGPTEWERERDHKVDHAKLEAQDGDRHGALHLKPLSLAAGLWKVTNSKGETLGAFCCYVDDGLVVGDAEIIRRVMAFVKSLWAVKGQGVLNKEGAGVEQGIQVDEDMVLLPKTELRFLGVEIEVDGANLALHQHKYIACELRKRGWLDLKGSDCLPTPKEGLLAPPLRDETFEQTKLRAQKEVDAHESVRLTRGIWRFLRATWDVRLMFRAKHEETPSQVVRMTADASFAPGGARSRTGYAIFMGDHLISWRSQRQALVAWSATEAELEATATVVQDGAKFQETLSELVGHKLELLLQNDNSGGLTLLTRQRFFTQDMRTRHFAVRCAYVRDQIAVLNIVLEHKGTDTLEADALTKVLSKEKLRQGRLGLRLLKK